MCLRIGDFATVVEKSYDDSYNEWYGAWVEVVGQISEFGVLKVRRLGSNDYRLFNEKALIPRSNR